MDSGSVDILYVGYNRPQYTQLSLPALLNGVDESVRVSIWQNGSDPETLEIVRSYLSHPRVHRFHHSEENVLLRTPTNWLWSEAKGDYLSKVDDDCLLSDGWISKLRQAHEECPEFGVVGCWRFLEEDFRPEIARKKIQEFAGGHRLLRNLWIEGSGYLMKRECVDSQGLLRREQSFTKYCIELARRGWIHGWYYPFINQEHMDDPRTPHTMLHTDADLLGHLPLSAKRVGVSSLDAWRSHLQRSALELQQASLDPRMYARWRRPLQRLVDWYRNRRDFRKSNGGGSRARR